MSGYIKKIQYYFFNRALKSLVQEHKERKMINLSDARKIGIIFDATLVHNTTSVAEFASILKTKHKEVDLLGFTEEVHIEEAGDSHLFNKKSLNWKLIPSKDNVDVFIEKEFDLLICAHIDRCAPLEYIAAVSNAKLRVGQFKDGMEFCYDLMINVGDEKDVSVLLKQILNFLNVVKAKKLD